jgi:glycosyltransferase involved in cell wall biosynthesis
LVGWHCARLSSDPPPGARRQPVLGTAVLENAAMRILLVTGSFPPMRCGVGDYTACLSVALSELPGMTVGVLTDQAAAGAKPDRGVDVMPVVKNWSAFRLPGIVRLIKRWNPDVVHLQYPTQGYAGWLGPWMLPPLLYGFRIPVVQTWHEYPPMRTHYYHLSLAMVPGGLVVVRPDYLEMASPVYRYLIGRKQYRFIPNAATVPRLRICEEDRCLVRERFGASDRKLVVYFGFLFPHKGVDLLFEIADPARHHLVVAGEMNSHDAYHAALRTRISQPPWAGRVTVTGFVAPDEGSLIMAAADAVVLPFRNGGGPWNTSLHGAMLQGVFVLTTSRDRSGYDAEHNVYYAQPGNVDEMRLALDRYMGCRTEEATVDHYVNWATIAAEHQDLYSSVRK